MTTKDRIRRSVLYTPGSNEKALAKGRQLAADVLILDLEDAVHPEQKVSARANIARVLQEGGYGYREMVVRCNGPDTPWGQNDIIMAANANPDALLIPKVENAEIVQHVVAILEQHNASDELQIWCMMETPKGILKAEEIANSHPRVSTLVMGTSDLAKGLQCAHTPMRLPMLMSLSQCILAARSADLTILDGVHLDLSDDEGFIASCQLGQELGFDGKTLIHPKTIGSTNEIFSPKLTDVVWAKKIIKAYKQATSEGSGVVVVDGKLVENLHIVMAQRTLSRFSAIQERL